MRTRQITWRQSRAHAALSWTAQPWVSSSRRSWREERKEGNTRTSKRLKICLPHAGEHTHVSSLAWLELHLGVFLGEPSACMGNACSSGLLTAQASPCSLFIPCLPYLTLSLLAGLKTAGAALCLLTIPVMVVVARTPSQPECGDRWFALALDVANLVLGCVCLTAWAFPCTPLVRGIYHQICGRHLPADLVHVQLSFRLDHAGQQSVP